MLADLHTDSLSPVMESVMKKLSSFPIRTFGIWQRTLVSSLWTAAMKLHTVGFCGVDDTVDLHPGGIVSLRHFDALFSAIWCSDIVLYLVLFRAYCYTSYYV